MNEDEIFSQRAFPSDDAVTIGVRSLAFHLIVTAVCWLISFLLILIHWIWRLIPWTTLFFLPMWIGSAYGFVWVILIIKRVCFSSRLITRQQREHMMHEREQTNGMKLIDYDSLLLLRYFLFAGGVICFSLLFIFVSQVRPSASSRLLIVSPDLVVSMVSRGVDWDVVSALSNCLLIDPLSYLSLSHQICVHHHMCALRSR
jgi:hypothetical protein